MQGIIMGLIGAGMAYGELRNRFARQDQLRLALSAVAGVICLGQIVYSIGLI